MHQVLKKMTKVLAFSGYRLAGLNVSCQSEWLSETLHWSAEMRQQWRLNRLNDILDFACHHVPFYREFWGDHGVRFRRLGHLDELQTYPVLSKAIFRANSQRFQPDNLAAIRHIHKHTGGSTSEPVRYLLDLVQWSFMEAFHLWGWSRAGYQFGDPVGVIAGGSLVPEKANWKNRIRALAQRRLFLYGVAMDRDLARVYHGRLVRHGTDFLYGYPSILYLFAKSLHEQGLRLPRLKAVFTTAEMLTQNYKQGIESWLGCPVFNNLGSNDGGFESYECQLHHGFHYNDLQAILEVEPMEIGATHRRLLITNLWNRATPFIRYENGDLVTLADELCPCGAAFPLIASIEGRTADILTFANGKSLAGPALTLIFGDMDIDGWQIVQTGDSSIEVRLCAKGELPAEYSERIRRILSFHLGNQVELVIRQTTRLEVTAGGKLKPIIKLAKNSS